MKKIWVIEEKRNPSTDYYIIPALKSIGLEKQIQIFNSPPEDWEERDIVLIFVRYLTRDWIDFVEKNKKNTKKIIYFMDDDLWDFRSWWGLPLRYIKKILLKSFQWKKWLFKIGALFWVSTEYLAEKYSSLNPIVIPPYPIFQPLPEIDTFLPYEILFYHGTSSHREEQIWLYSLFNEILSVSNCLLLEMIIDKKISKRFRNFENMIMLYPMPWPVYKDFLLSKMRTIGLVPLFFKPFNKARSYTKFFEIVACRAVGIFTKDSIYAKVIQHEENGLLIRNDPNEWIKAIKTLLENRELRTNLYINSFNLYQKLKTEAENIYRKNLGGMVI